MPRWKRLYDAAWTKRAHDPRVPAYVRLACLAYARVAANGHARMEPGELARLLATVDPVTGEVTLPDRQTVYNHVTTAIERGWVEDGSNSRCLIVDRDAVENVLGNRHEPCPVTHRPRPKRRRTKPDPTDADGPADAAPLAEPTGTSCDPSSPPGGVSPQD